MVKIKTTDDELKDLRYKTEKQDQEKNLNSLEVDNEYHKKKYRSLNKENVLSIITEMLFGSASTFSSSTMGSIKPGAGNII